MTAFRRKNGWAAKFVVDHKQHWVPDGPWETKRQAQEAERRHRDRLNARRSDETCASFADRWLSEWPRDSASTQAIYRRAAERFADHFGPTPLGEVGVLEARTWALSVPRKVSVVMATMYADARRVGLVEHNPFTDLRLPGRYKAILCPTVEEFQALLASCLQLGGYAKEFRALLQFTAWSCLRSGEMMALRWEDVEQDEIWVRRSRKTDGTYGLPKSGEEEPVPFIEPARVLDQVPRRPDPYVFHGARGGPLSHATLYHYWDKVRGAVNTERAAEGKPVVRFHDLRHFGATQLLEMGFSHFDVSVHLRHHDNGVLVMDRYGHPSRENARERLLAGFGADAAGIGSQGGSRALDQQLGRAQ